MKKIMSFFIAKRKIIIENLSKILYNKKEVI